MRVTASKLRENVYRILDQVIEKGEPVEIVRNGHVLRIVPEGKPSRLARLSRKENVLKGDPEDIVHMDWSKEWKGR